MDTYVQGGLSLAGSLVADDVVTMSGTSLNTLVESVANLSATVTDLSTGYVIVDGLTAAGGAAIGATTAIEYVSGGCGDPTYLHFNGGWGPHWAITNDTTSADSICAYGETRKAIAGARCCTSAGGSLPAQCPAGSCQLHTYQESLSLCVAAGGRLCTQAEVLAGVVGNSGCSYDTMHVWTSTLCTL